MWLGRRPRFLDKLPVVFGRSVSLYLELADFLIRSLMVHESWYSVGRGRTVFGSGA